jgi:hypothetical protein
MMPAGHLSRQGARSILNLSRHFQVVLYRKTRQEFLTDPFPAARYPKKIQAKAPSMELRRILSA